MKTELRRTIFLPLLTLSLLTATLNCLATETINATTQTIDTTTKIFAQLKNNAQFSGDFQQVKTLKDMPFPILATGQFEFDAATGLQWNIQEPIASQLLITPMEMVQTENNTEVFRINSAEQPVAGLISKLFFAIFAGDEVLLKQHFSIADKKNIEGKDELWSLQLTPNSPIIASAIIKIDVQGDTQLNSFTLFETSGDQTHVVISNIQPHAH